MSLRQLFNNPPIIAARWDVLKHCDKSGQNPQGTAATPAPSLLPWDKEGAHGGQAVPLAGQPRGSAPLFPRDYGASLALPAHSWKDEAFWVLLPPAHRVTPGKQRRAVLRTVRVAAVLISANGISLLPLELTQLSQLYLGRLRDTGPR